MVDWGGGISGGIDVDDLVGQSAELFLVLFESFLEFLKFLLELATNFIQLFAKLSLNSLSCFIKLGQEAGQFGLGIVEDLWGKSFEASQDVIERAVSLLLEITDQGIDWKFLLEFLLEFISQITELAKTL